MKNALNRTLLIVALAAVMLTALVALSGCESDVCDHLWPCTAPPPARAVSRPVVPASRLYGTCWSCMHGCTRQQNIELCHVDPEGR